MSGRLDAVEVTVDLEGREVVAGMLRVYERHGQSITFEYSEDYLRHRAGPLGPEPLAPARA